MEGIIAQEPRADKVRTLQVPTRDALGLGFVAAVQDIYGFRPTTGPGGFDKIPQVWIAELGEAEVAFTTILDRCERKGHKVYFERVSPKPGKPGCSLSERCGKHPEALRPQLRKLVAAGWLEDCGKAHNAVPNKTGFRTRAYRPNWDRVKKDRRNRKGRGKYVVVPRFTRDWQPWVLRPVYAEILRLCKLSEDTHYRHFCRLCSQHDITPSQEAFRWPASYATDVVLEEGLTLAQAVEEMEWPHGVCTVSGGEIADALGLERRRVGRAIDALCELGYVRRGRKRGFAPRLYVTP